jgi:hypothetical protein
MSQPQRKLQVFLCHSSHDKQIVRDIYWRLRSDGCEPWFDEENLLPGQDWHSEIEKAVHSTDIVIVCLSKESINKTGFVQKEIKYALDVADEYPDGTIFLIPLRLEECIVPERLRRWQWVNFYDRTGYERLLKALRHRANSLGISVVSHDIAKLREYRPCPLIAAILQVEELFRTDLTRRGIKLEVVADPRILIDVPLYIVSLALVNLVSNAKEALTEGGTIKIEAEDEGQMILCHVTDTGSGIPEEKLDKIFDLGYTTKPKSGGWGLYMVAHTLRANAGDISASIIPSLGMRFTLRLPKYKYESRT